MAAPITDAGSGVVRNRPVPAALDRSLGEVVARGKAFSGTAQNDDTNIVVDIGLFQYGEQFAPQLIAHGVALLRTIERHPQDRFAGTVDLQIFEAILVSAHAISLHVRSIAGFLFCKSALPPIPSLFFILFRTFFFF